MSKDRALLEQELTEKIIGAAIEVHRELGPGLLESAYKACLLRAFSVSSVSPWLPLFSEVLR